MRTFSEEEVLKRLRTELGQGRGAVSALSSKYGIPWMTLSRVLRGERRIGERTARALGYERVVRYRRIAS